LPKHFTVELLRNMNLSCLFTNTARQIYSKAKQLRQSLSFYKHISYVAGPYENKSKSKENLGPTYNNWI